jgi:hypothetical protein
MLNYGFSHLLVQKLSTLVSTESARELLKRFQCSGSIPRDPDLVGLGVGLALVIFSKLPC